MYKAQFDLNDDFERRSAMKKIICLLLSMTLCLSFGISAAAIGNDSVVVAVDKTNTITLEDGTVFSGEDLPNGDAVFTLVNSQTGLHRESYLNRATGIVTTTDKSTNTVLQELSAMPQIELSAASSNSARSTSSNYVYRGTITYNFYGNTGSVVGTRALNVYYDYNYYPGSRFNVSGQFQDITSFAAYLCGALSISTIVANPFASAIFSALGFGLSQVNVMIENHYIRCTETEITWKAEVSDATDVYETFTGSKFVLTQEGYDNEVCYDGDFWPLTSYTNHDTDFAVHLYWGVLWQDVLEIVNWS